MRALVLCLLWPLSALAQGAPVDQGPPNAGFSPAFVGQTRAPALAATPVSLRLFARGLERPWGIAALPDGSYLVTERPGRLRVVSADGSVSAPIGGVPQVDARRQGGLLDVAIGPDFASDRRVWLSYAKRVAGGTVTAVAHGALSADGTRLDDLREVFVQHPPSPTPLHFGSRIVFDARGHVFITTGEHATAAERVLAQDNTTTYGKVIRLATAGGIPADNPFIGRAGDDAIWSTGHRNVQGAAIEPRSGLLWTVEHGPRGGDELNQPEPAGNYGWPLVSYGVDYDGRPIGTGAASMPGIEEPVYYWDPVIAPGGMTFYTGRAFPDWRGDLLIASLNPGALVRLRIADGRVTGEERLVRDVGRIRDVEETASGALLLLIDAPDGAIIEVAPGG